MENTIHLDDSAPEMIELGDLVDLTKGDGTSDKWDIGSGYRESGGSGSGPLHDD